jgi:cytochrome c-type biogenesis protein CcmF
MGATIQTPSIHSYLWQDLYVSPAGFDPERNPARPILQAGNSSMMGPYEITFLDFEIDREAMMSGGEVKVGANVKVVYEGQESILTPEIKVITDPESGEQRLERVPAILPQGQTLDVIEVDPTNRAVLLEGKGEGIDGLPIVPAKGLIAVSVKPLVILVWTGVVIGVIGGFIALIRRYLEGQAVLAGRSARLPKGLPLPDFLGRLRRSPRPSRSPGAAD